MQEAYEISTSVNLKFEKKKTHTHTHNYNKIIISRCFKKKCNSAAKRIWLV